jgi:hypothetical protein
MNSYKIELKIVRYIDADSKEEMLEMLNRFIDNNELEISLDDDILTIEEEKES